MAALTVIAARYQKNSVASGHLIANDIGMFITTMGIYHFLVTAEITLKPLARYLLSVCPSIVPGAIAARAAQLRGPPAWLRYCSSRQHPIIASSKLGNATSNTGDGTTRKANLQHINPRSLARQDIKRQHRLSGANPPSHWTAAALSVYNRKM